MCACGSVGECGLPYRAIMSSESLSYFVLSLWAVSRLSVLCSLAVQLSVNCHCLRLLTAGAK